MRLVRGGWRFSSGFVRLTAIALAVVVAAGAPSALASREWPGLRGPNYDGAVRDAQWITGGDASLEVGWKVALGSGYSAVAVADGKVVTMFVDGEHDVMGAFDPSSGEELWRYAFGETYPGHDGSHDGPIATPLIANGHVYGVGPWGHVFAVDGSNGEVKWKTHLVDDHGATKPHYGFSSSPVLVDGVLVLPINGGEGKAIAGFDPATGEVEWTLGDDQIEYQSPIVTTIDGKTRVIATGNTKMFGIDAAEGEIAWSYEHGGSGGAIGTGSVIPVPAGDGRFLVTNKSDASTMLRVKPNADDVVEVEELWSTNVFRGTYVTPVYHDGHVYGITGRVLTCVEAETGEIKWRSREPGDGFPTLVGDKLVIMTKPGSLHVAEASPEGYTEVAKVELFDEHSWSEIAFAGGHVFARSMENLARVDLVGGGAAVAPAAAIAMPAVHGSSGFTSFLQEVSAASGDTKGALIDAYLDGRRFPVIEEPDLVHFVYRGEATDVGIVGDMIGFRREDPMTRLDGTDLFYYSTRIEPNAAMTYGFLPDFGDAVADPLNDRVGRGLFGEVSWFAMPAWSAPDFVDEADASHQGRIETFEWESAVKEGAARKAEVYLPAGYDGSDARYPVVYFHEGNNALEAGAMKNALDNLIGSRVAPLIAVFVLPPEENPRADLGQIDSYMTMLVDELVPAIDDKYRTNASAGARAMFGVGNGAAGALYGAFKHPDRFGRVAAQSPIWFLRGEKTIQEWVSSADEQPVAVYLEWARYDLRSPHEAWDMRDNSREFQDLLRERGFRPMGGEVAQGFGWDCWRERTDDVLSALFPVKG